MRLSELIQFLDELLSSASFEDFCPNGLQVPGMDNVETIVTGVSAHEQLFAAAIEHDADLILVHHGLFWNNSPRALDAPMARKLRMLLEREIGLAAYHLPLDAHIEHGNNALLAAALGAESWTPFAPLAGSPIGVAAEFAGEGISREDLVTRVRDATGGREPLAFLHGPERVRTLGLVSGAAPDSIHDAIAGGLDAFLTGEPAERVMAIARENAITFIAGGHHATETRGVQKLGELLAERFGVRHEFIDVPNPI